MNKKLVSFVTMASIIFTSVSPVFAKNFDSKQNVALDHAWTVNFNQKVNVNEAFEGVYIKDSKGNKIPTRVDFSEDHTKMIIKSTDGYAPNSTYTLNVEGVSDEDGKPLSDKATMQFTTANAAQVGSFDITSVTANNGQGAATTNLDPNSSFSFQLSKNVDPSTVNNVTVTDKDGNKANVKVEVTGNSIGIVANNNFQDDTKTITVPENTYKCNTTYTVNLAGVKSTDGQDISTKTYNFTTRDYQLNPTISGICEDDYIRFVDKYAQQYFNPIDPATGYVTVGMCHAHDNNGTLVYDNDPLYGQPKYQPDGHWNTYANLQARNQYDLQLEFQNEYSKIRKKDSSYPNNLVSFGSSVLDLNDNRFDLQLNNENPQDPTTFTTSIYNDPSLDAYSFQREDNYSPRGTKPISNIQKVQHAQIFIALTNENGTRANLQKTYLYQQLVSLFGYDYADELLNFILQEHYGSYAVQNTLQTIKIGNITIWAQNGQFLFKY